MVEPIEDAGDAAARAAKRAVERFTQAFQKMADDLREAKIKRLDLEHELTALGYDIGSAEYSEILESGKIPCALMDTNLKAIPPLQGIVDNQRDVVRLEEEMRLKRGNRNLPSREEIDAVATRITREVDAAVEAHLEKLFPSPKALVVTKTVPSSADDGVRAATPAAEQLAEDGKGIAKWANKHRLPLAAGAVALAAGGYALMRANEKAEAEAKPKQL